MKFLKYSDSYKCTKTNFFKKAIDNKLKENVSQHTIINLYENEIIIFQNQPKNPFMNRAQLF